MSRWIAVPVGVLVAAILGDVAGGCKFAPPRPLRQPIFGHVVFEPNRGQAAPSVEFIARAGDLTAAISASGMQLSLTGAPPVSLHWQGVAPGVRGVPRRSQNAVTNYLIGDRSRWVRHVPRYGEVRYQGLYRGVDLRYYDAAGDLEYDLELAPGVDPAAIRLRIEGAAEVGVSEAGELRIRAGDRTIVKALPAIYQTVAGGARRPLRGAFVQRAPAEVGFVVEGADPSLGTVIDPKILTSTYIGGPKYDGTFEVAVDSARNAYVAGVTEKPGLPGTVVPGRVASGFIAKYDRKGKLRVFTYLGGSKSDGLYQIAVFEGGSAGPDGAFVVVGGATLSKDLPTVRPIQQTIDDKYGDVFIGRLNLALDAVDFLTPLGGSDRDFMATLAVGSDGRILAAGSTWSDDLPLVSPTQKKRAGENDAWLAVIDVDAPGGPRLAFSSLLGGKDVDGLDGAAWTEFATSRGAARTCMLISGVTFSRDLPTVNALQPEIDLGHVDEFGDTFADAYLSMWCERAGKAPEHLYSSYYGGTLGDYDNDLQVDSAGRAVLVLETGSRDLPLQDPLYDELIDDEPGLSADLALAVFDLAGLVQDAGRVAPARMVFATYMPRGGAQARPVAALGKDDTVYVVSESTPVRSSRNSVLPVLVDYGASASRPPAVRWLEEIGGSGYDLAFGVAVDRKQRLHMVGFTDSDDWPLVKAAQEVYGGGYSDGFYLVLKR